MVIPYVLIISGASGEESAQAMTGLSRLTQVIRLRDTTQPFDRLVKFNWTGQFIVTFAGMIASFLIAGFWYPYWRIADMDFWVVYNALLLNAHLPQEYFDHPGYLPILLLSYWLRALHWVGLIRTDSLSSVTPVNDLATFDPVWMQLTQAGRVLSLLLAIAFVAAFTLLLRALIRDPRIAGLGGFLLAFSGGVEMQMRTMRTELLAAGLFTLALLIMLVAAKKGEGALRPALIGFASLLITLGLLSKVQIIFLICALPLLLLPFGPDSKPQPGFWHRPRQAWPAVSAALLIALLAAYLAKDIIVFGFSHSGATISPMPLPTLRLGARIYWPLIAVWIGVGMAAYSIVWRVVAPEALASMFAALAGSMIGLLALYARYHPDNVIVVFHPLETLLAWGSSSDSRLVSGGPLLNAARLQFLLHAISGLIERRTFFLQSSARPTIFLEWFVIAATVIAIRRRNWNLVLAVTALMLTDWGVDLLGMARGLEGAYFTFTDPLAIIAAALLLARLKDLQEHRWTYPLGVTLIVATVVVGQAEPVKHVFSTVGRQVLCNQQSRFPRLGALPFCAAQPAQPK